MFPFYNVFNFQLASYGSLILLGLIMGITTSIILVNKYLPHFKEDVFYAFLFAFIGVVIGGKLLFLLVSVPEIISLIEHEFPISLIIQNFVMSGYVFYGSVIGAIASIKIYSRLFSVSFETLLRYLTPSIPIIHAFGRLGCLAAGCCYGIPMKSFGYQLNRSFIAPRFITLFPTQLLESIYCFLIFIVILFLFIKRKSGYTLIKYYILMYGPFRFILEFFRGDIERGIIGIFSTYQIISLILLLAIFLINIKKIRQKA